MNLGQLVLFFGVITLIAVVGFVMFNQPSLVIQSKSSAREAGAAVINEGSNKHSIVLHDSGFEPRRSTIRMGDTVTFSTTRGKPYWPASNLHPRHNIYRDFDPLKPVSFDGTWSFIFNRVGEWQFHDHIRSYYRGTITVVEE